MNRNILFLVIGIYGCLSQETPSVVTKSGKIIGHYLKSYGGHKYEAYHGIPYALPPTGERRFKAPEPIQSWSNELIANKLRSSCWQNDCAIDRCDEDCLYLNVFVPERQANKTLPVLFWIYGGGFTSGSSQPEEESFIMDYDVILVTIQYRLGVFGFLSTGDDVVSGNMGLKDQSLALRWIHDNIEYFSGNPKKMTIYGQSAGAASVHYHYLSPMSAGLFQNGVSFSGTAFDWWALKMTKTSRDRAFKVGQWMNCTTSSTKQMIDCLRKRPVRDLVETQIRFMAWRTMPPIPFGPVVEKSSGNAFINRSPQEIIESGQAYDAPWITGVTRDEGAFIVSPWANDEALKNVNDNWNKFAPLLLGYYDSVPEENQTQLVQTIRKHYFGEEKPIDRTIFTNLINLVSHQWFYVDAEKAAKAQAKANKNPVWFYRYSYRATDSFTNHIANSLENFGVCHGDDVYLFMKNPVITPTKSSNDMLMQKHLIEILTSFSDRGIPTVDHVEWSKVDPKEALNYLEISGPQNIKLQTTSNFGQKDFWNSILTSIKIK